MRPAAPWLPARAVFVERVDGVNQANTIGIVPITVAAGGALGPSPVTIAEPVGAFVIAIPPQTSRAPGETRAAFRERMKGFVAHESGHGAHELASAQRDRVEGRGSAADDIRREVAVILSPGVTLPTSGPDLRNEYVAEAFRTAVTGDLSTTRYPAPPGERTPYPLAEIRAYVRSMAVPRIIVAAGPRVIDIRGELPFIAANLPWPTTSFKTSATIHWPGGEFDAATDDDVRNLIHAFAQEHIAKDWSSEMPGVQGGSGLMYAEVIAPSGTTFITRDPDAVLWHSNSSDGNQVSMPILIVCSESHPPTSAQLITLRSRLVVHGLRPFPHSDWTNTQCPGDALRAYLAGQMEDDMFTEEDRRKLDRVYAHAEAYEALDWIGRLQRWLGRALKSIYPAVDLSGPDVKTGEPYKQ